VASIGKPAILLCSSLEYWRTKSKPSELPDIAVPRNQFDLIKLKWERAKNTFIKAKSPTMKQRLAYKSATQKLKTATSIFNSSPVKKRAREQFPEKTKNSPKECIFVDLALKIPCHIVKNTLLQTALSAILPTGLE